MAQRQRNLRLEARWRELVARQSKSGLGVRGFCQREQVTESAFYAWRRELRLRGQEQPIPKSAFVPVVLPPAMAPEGEGQIIIELRGGRVLRLPPALPLARITELVGAVEAAL